MKDVVAGASVSNQSLLPTYSAGVCTHGTWDMLSVLVPLHAVTVGLNAAEVGFIVAARSILPAVLAIHGGILIDQFGSKRVLTWVAGTSALLPLIYPLSGWFAALVMLQLFLGLSSQLGMTASQIWAMRISQGNTALLARYSIATNIGACTAPVLAGAIWDHLGTWAAFSCVTVFASATILAASHNRIRAPAIPAGRSLLPLLVPSWQAHKETLLLAMIPAVAFLLVATALRNSSGAIQISMFVVYLEGIGFTGMSFPLFFVFQGSGIKLPFCAHADS